MKFRIWLWKQRMLNGIKAIYKNWFLVNLRRSLVYNIFSMLFIVIGVLWVIFQFLPHSAHMAYSPTSVRTAMCTASSATIEMTGSHLSITSHGEMVIGRRHHDEIIADDKIYDSSYELKIIPKDDNSSFFMHSNNDEVVSIDIETYHGDSIDTVGLFSHGKYTDVTSQYGFSLYLHNPIYLSFNPEEAYLVKEGCEPIPVSYVAFQEPSKSFYIMCNASATLNLPNIYDTFIQQKSSMEFFGVYEAIIESVGTLHLYYSADGNNFEINEQQIILESKSRSMRIGTEYDKSIVNFHVSGVVSVATATGVDLFPTFGGWYRDNILIAPLALITTIFGGVTIMLNKRKST